jgi:hypothetical protein
MFTARYALSAYIKEIRFVFKGLMLQSTVVTIHATCFKNNVSVFYPHSVLFMCYVRFLE